MGEPARAPRTRGDGAGRCLARLVVRKRQHQPYGERRLQPHHYGRRRDNLRHLSSTPKRSGRRILHRYRETERPYLRPNPRALISAPIAPVLQILRRCPEGGLGDADDDHSINAGNRISEPGSQGKPRQRIAGTRNPGGRVHGLASKTASHSSTPVRESRSLTEEDVAVGINRDVETLPFALRLADPKAVIGFLEFTHG